MVHELHQNKCFDMGAVPVDWCGAYIVLLYKGNGGQYEYNNSGSISLLRVVGKLYGRLLIKRDRERTECAIGEE